MNLEWLPIPSDSLADGALMYAKAGWPIFPCRGKQPLTAHGLRDASSDPHEVARMWREHPTANVGWPVREGWIALDVDPRHDGDKSLRELERRHGPLPFTLRAQTGSGGEHWVFRVPKGVELRQLANFAGKELPGLDTRLGGRGYLLVAPSVHPDTGKPYRWLATVEPVEPPAWLVEMLRVPPAPPPVPYKPPTASREMDKRRRYAQAVLEGCANDVRSSAKGGRNDTLNRAWWRVLKFRDALDIDNARAALTEAAQAVGLTDIEIRRTLR